jgi:hypothetical protein
LAFDLYEIDYLFKEANQPQHSDSDNYHENTRNFHSMSSQWFARLPHILTNEVVKSSIRENYKWCKLEQQDFLMLPFPSVLDSLLVSPSEDTKRFLMHASLPSSDNINIGK